jgi:hypothetical protein
LPKAHISVLEYDEKCAQEFRSTVDQLFIGDQSDTALLKRISQADSHYYDVIIDDGGHTRKQIITTFLNLWHKVKPDGGVYIVEDLFYSFTTHSAINDNPQSIIDYIAQLIFLFNNDSEKFEKNGKQIVPENMRNISQQLMEVFESLLSVNCYHSACVFVKKYF